VQALRAEIAELSRAVAQHRLFTRMVTVADVRVFMAHHVWAVWDFMSLVKSIQREIAPARAPWVPPADTASARLINELVLGEESDDGPDGEPLSHFAIYLRAMAEAGAAVAPINDFVAQLTAGAAWRTALGDSRAPAAAKAFVRTTLEVCEGPLSGRVAAFTLGREEIIPAMFTGVVNALAGAGDLCRFKWYLDRHIVVDGDRHGPMAAALFARICAVDAATHEASLTVARNVLAARLALWDAAAIAIA
jgi:hypothetical protein